MPRESYTIYQCGHWPGLHAAAGRAGSVLLVCLQLTLPLLHSHLAWFVPRYVWPDLKFGHQLAESLNSRSFVLLGVSRPVHLGLQRMMLGLMTYTEFDAVPSGKLDGGAPEDLCYHQAVESV